jgi:hypothetical protein
VRAVRRLRPLAALVAVLGLLAFLGMPVCDSPACPMSAGERAACKAMGRECCGTAGGQLSHAPAAPLPVLAAVPSLPAVGAPVPFAVALQAPSRPLAAPAVLQGVGLFTLFAVFLI